MYKVGENMYHKQSNDMQFANLDFYLLAACTLLIFSSLTGRS